MKNEPLKKKCEPHGTTLKVLVDDYKSIVVGTFGPTVKDLTLHLRHLIQSLEKRFQQNTSDLLNQEKLNGGMMGSHSSW